MKTATIRDLRNHFSDVAKWIEDGEEISITKRGEPFAVLSPTKQKSLQRANWATRLKERPPVGNGISKVKTTQLWSDLRD